MSSRKVAGSTIRAVLSTGWPQAFGTVWGLFSVSGHPPPPPLPWDLEQTNLFLSECQDPAISAHSASATPTLHMDIHSLIMVYSVASH